MKQTLRKLTDSLSFGYESVRMHGFIRGDDESCPLFTIQSMYQTSNVMTGGF